MEFKVGDRVNVYASFMSNEPLRGTIVDNCASQKDTILLKVRFDNFRGISSHEEWIHAQQCRKLVKKRKFIDSSNFQCGDRVVIKGGSESFIGKKGTIVYVTRCGEYAELVIDDPRTKFEAISIKSLNLYTKNLKKLIKKKTEFKVGDRVSCETLGDRLKGTIEDISSDENVIKVKIDNLKHIAICRPKHLKKLVKKKKSKFNIIKEAINYLNENGKKLDEIDNKTVNQALADLIKMSDEFKDSMKDKFNREPELLPCPFCGSLECYLTLRNLLIHCLASIKCSKCGSSSGEIDNEETAIKNWNRRSYP